MPPYFTSVLVSCDAKLRGQPELLLAIQDFLLPVLELDLSVAPHRGARMFALWYTAATLLNVSIDDYPDPALFAAIQQSGLAFLDHVIPLLAPQRWTSVANSAVRSNDRVVLQALHERIPALAAPSALEIAAGMGDLELIKWVHERTFGGSVATKRTWTRAAATGRLDIIQWLAVNTPPRDYDAMAQSAMNFAANFAANYGHLHVLRWLHDNTGIWWSPHALGAALSSHHFEVARWMYEVHDVHHCADGEGKEKDAGAGSRALKLSKAINEALDNGDVSVLDWLRERQLLPALGAQHVARAKKGGHVCVLDYIKSNYPNFPDTAWQFTVACASNGSLPVAMWAERNGQLDLTGTVVIVAAMNGHIEFIRWYLRQLEDKVPHELIPKPFHGRALEVAASRGHFECVRVLLERKYSPVTPEAIIEAARSGHLAIAQYLAEQLRARLRIPPGVVNNPRFIDERAARRWQRVSQAAAEAGDGDCVGATEWWLGTAMNAAAGNGHFEAVKWIQRMQLFTLDASAFLEAAANGHVEMVEYIWRHTSDIDVLGAVREAVARGQLRVVKYLLSHFPQTPETRESLMDQARRHGHVPIALWIRQLGWSQQ